MAPHSSHVKRGGPGYEADHPNEFPSWGKEHPTEDCCAFMRDVLEGDLDDLYNEAPKHKDWRTLTADAGVPFPTARDIRLEDWGHWLNEVTEQLRNAACSQVASYYREKYEECPVCGSTWTRR